MNMSEAMALLANVLEIETIAETLTTPDGRWTRLQDWLANHPKWKKEIDSWVNMTPDEAFNSLRDYTAKRASMPPIVLESLIDAGMRFRVKKSIQTLQALYRERRGDQKHERISEPKHPDRSA